MPDPRDLPVLLFRVLTCGNRPSEGLDPTFFEHIRDGYSPIVRLPIPGRPDIYFLSDPEYVGHVLESNQENYRKYRGQVKDLKTIFGHGLVTARGDHWKQHKQVLAPMFSQDAATIFEERIKDSAETAFTRWGEVNGAITLEDDVLELVLEVLGRVLFGEAFNESRTEVEHGLKRISGAFPRYASPLPPLPVIGDAPGKQVEEGRQILDAAIEDMIDTVEELSSEQTFVHWLVAAEELDKHEVRDELRTLLIAGLVVATALTWTLYNIADHEAVQADLVNWFNEMASIDTTPPAKEATLLDRVVQESLRLYPPLPPAIRSPVTDDNIDGYRVPAGVRILVNQVHIHRDPELWDEPLAFRPERFHDGWRTEQPSYSYYPFGGGRRACIGRSFAYMMLERTLQVGVPRFKLRTTANRNTTEMNPISPTDLKVTVRPRSG
jgi:cytochrome P450